MMLILFNMGVCYENTKNEQKATEYYQKSIEHKPTSIAHHRLAILHHAMGMITKQSIILPPL